MHAETKEREQRAATSTSHTLPAAATGSVCNHLHHVPPASACLLDQLQLLFVFQPDGGGHRLFPGLHLAVVRHSLVRRHLDHVLLGFKPVSFGNALRDKRFVPNRRLLRLAEPVKLAPVGRLCQSFDLCRISMMRGWVQRRRIGIAQRLSERTDVSIHLTPTANVSVLLACS